MITIMQSLLFGFFGGVVRALVGIVKNVRKKKDFMIGRLIFTIIASAIIGAFAGILVVGDYRVAALAGYAGTDLIEGIYRASKRY